MGRQINHPTLIALILSLGLISAFPPKVYSDGDVVVSLSGTRIAESQLAVADFNGDGKKEIVVGGNDGKLYVIDGATYTVRWEKQITNYMPGYNQTLIESSITIADLNRNGTQEIVVATGDDPGFRQVGAVIVLTYVGGSTQFNLLPGWPRFGVDETGDPANPSFPDGVPDGFQSTPAVGDLDGNGDLEIVIAGQDRRLHAWHHNGQYVTGWPIDRSKNLFRGGASSPALADIDKDGLPEIIVGTNSYAIAGCPNPYVFLALNGDASLVPGFPVYANQNFHSSPAVGDIDGDGWLDIVVGTGDYNESCWLVGSSPDGRKIHAWDHNGKPLPGWPKTTGGNMLASPTLGDLDGDGNLEVVIGCGFHYHAPNPGCTSLYAWHGDGSNVAGFPMSPQSIDPDPYPIYNAQPYSPILADYDGDGAIEIMTVGAGSRGISIVEPDGMMNPDTRRATPKRLFTAPLIDDIDGDGLLETVIGGANVDDKAAIYIWQETGTTNSARPWPMFHHDVARSGLYVTPPVPQLGLPREVRVFHQQGEGDTETLLVNIKNIGTGQFNWQITNVNGGLQFSPTSGTVSSSSTTQLVVTTTGVPLNTWHRVGDFTISGTVNGQPATYSPRLVPVWLYSGDIQRYYFPMMRNNS